MFIGWGYKWQYEVKKNGLQVNKFCPACYLGGEFFEVIPTKHFIFCGIRLSCIKTDKPLLECPHCQDRINIKYDDHSNSSSSVLSCKRCGQKLRIPIKKHLLKITCPSCNEIFYLQKGGVVDK
jgi:uncharacterized protein YbaR (Trm112 family)